MTGVLTVRRSTFAGNRGGNGEALASIAARITVEDSRFEGNATQPAIGNPFAGGRGGHGGAIYVDGTSLGALTLRRTTVAANQAANLGGAIHSWMYGLPSALEIEDCTFAGNAGTTNGGAVFHMNGRLSISGSTFSGNTVVGQGGAVWEGEADAGQTPVTITNSTFTGNSATGIRPNSGTTGLGGAIRDNGSPTTLTHVTIVGNHADWVGGGIVGGSRATLRASIVASNTAAVVIFEVVLRGDLARQIDSQETDRESIRTTSRALVRRSAAVDDPPAPGSDGGRRRPGALAQ